ncbi:class C sortase [Bifidobacterium sp. ESL0690]|uniref:class C sortase n=1 Tax=Bifidobacterium sp. ESL0690 TaxID=2983214 RepID=UPI0023F8DD9B|nr:class C sortase [Bifidobacterium sp. ESL0690]WEV46612.1 class C sortase [Bifidobacterium sp. ESL0690]
MKKRHSEPPQVSHAIPTTFDAIIAGNEGLNPVARGGGPLMLLMKLVVGLLLLGGVAMIGYPFVLQAVNAFKQASQTQSLEWQMDHKTTEEQRKALVAADQYNQQLAQSGQSIMGDVTDPFDKSIYGGGDHSNTVEVKDKRYQSMLDEGGGVMGMVIVPKIAVDLPIYHGTSVETMDIGAGHMYGTSLPAGGSSTHTVLVSHNGLTRSLLFTRLDEMKKGDAFYIHVPGRKMGYRVDRISVIRPDDTSKLKIEAGADRATLMTCFPYGVNDHRLLVQGVRDHSLDKQYPDNFGRLVMSAIMAVTTAIAVLIIGISIIVIIKYRHPQERPAGHAQKQIS